MFKINLNDNNHVQLTIMFSAIASLLVSIASLLVTTLK